MPNAFFPLWNLSNKQYHGLRTRYTNHVIESFHRRIGSELSRHPQTQNLSKWFNDYSEEKPREIQTVGLARNLIQVRASIDWKPYSNGGRRSCLLKRARNFACFPFLTFVQHVELLTSLKEGNRVILHARPTVDMIWMVPT